VTSVADLLVYANQSIGAGPDAAPMPVDRQQVAQLLFLTYSAPYERFLDRSYSRTAVWALLRTDRTAVVDSVLQRVKQFVAAHPAPSGVEVKVAGGIGPVVVAINEETTRGKAWNVGLLYLVIFVVGSMLLRSLVAGVLIVVPLAISLVFDLGVLGASGIDLDLSTASILSIGVAIGADYVIYLIYRVQEEIGNGLELEAALRRTLATSGKAVWFVAFAIAGGYAVLAPFPFRPMRLAGILVPITMVVACSSAVSLIPALLLLLRPSFLWQRRVADPIPVAEAWRLSA
jgi:predicted RND superfamily exporter protein